MPIITASMAKPTRHERKRRDEATKQRPYSGGDRGRGADERVDPLLGRTLEVTVDQRLHRQQERRAQPAEDRPKMITARRSWASVIAIAPTA